MSLKHSKCTLNEVKICMYIKTFQNYFGIKDTKLRDFVNWAMIFSG